MNPARFCCLLFACFLIFNFAFALDIDYETSSAARIIGETPEQMQDILNSKYQTINYATYYSSELPNPIGPVGKTNQLLATVFEYAKLDSQINPGWSWDSVNSSIDSWNTKGGRQLFILQAQASIENNEIVMRDNSLGSSLTAGFNEIGEKEVGDTNWENGFSNSKPLFVSDTPYTGIYLPKSLSGNNSIVSKYLARSTAIIAPTKTTDPLMVNSFVCSLLLSSPNLENLGDRYRNARNNYKEYVKSAQPEILESYSFYGNPLNNSMKVPLLSEQELKDNCDDFASYNSLTVGGMGLQSLSEDLNNLGNGKHRLRKEAIFNNYAIVGEGQWQLLNVEDLINPSSPTSLFLPSRTEVAKFPLMTIISNVELAEMSDPVDFNLNIPSFDGNFFGERICTDSNREAGIALNHAFTEDKELIIMGINPIEVVDCNAGLFRLYRRVTYDIEYDSYSPILLEVAGSTGKVLPEGEVDFNLSLKAVETGEHSGLVRVTDGNTVFAEQPAIVNGRANLAMKITAPNEEGPYSYRVEFLQDNNIMTATYLDFEVELIKPQIETLFDGSSTGTVNLSIDNRGQIAMPVLVKHYLMKENNVIQDGNFQINLNSGMNNAAITYPNLSKSDRSYSVLIVLIYDNRTKIVSGALVTNNPPVIKPMGDINVSAGKIVEIIPFAADADNDPITYTISDPVGNTGLWQTDMGNEGDYNVVITASDGLLEDSYTVRLHVGPPVIDCYSDFDCGENFFTEENKCLADGRMVNVYRKRICGRPGTRYSTCTASDENIGIGDCIIRERFSDGNAEEMLEFPEDGGEKIVYLEIPKNAVVREASLGVSGFDKSITCSSGNFSSTSPLDLGRTTAIRTNKFFGGTYYYTLPFASTIAVASQGNTKDGPLEWGRVFSEPLTSQTIGYSGVASSVSLYGALWSWNAGTIYIDLYCDNGVNWTDAWMFNSRDKSWGAWAFSDNAGEYCRLTANNSYTLNIRKGLVQPGSGSGLWGIWAYPSVPAVRPAYEWYVSQFAREAAIVSQPWFRGNVKKLYLDSNALLYNQAIDYYVSIDDGINWISIPNKGEVVISATSKQDIVRWKAVLKTNHEAYAPRMFNFNFCIETASPVENPSIDIGNNGVNEWSYDGNYASSEQISFAGELNNYLASHTDAGENILVPVRINSASGGLIFLGNLNVKYVTEQRFSPVILSYSPSQSDFSTTEGKSIEFSVRAFDPNNDTLNHEWIFDGNHQTGADANKLALYMDYNSAGIHNLTAIASDGNMSVSTSWIITVSNINQPPIIESYSPFGNQAINVGQSQVFTVNKFDADLDDLSVTWLLDGSLALENQDSFAYTAGNNSVGDHNITVIVSDGKASDSHEWLLTVLRVNLPPIIENYSPLENPTISEGDSRTFTIRKSDPDSNNLTVEWQLDNALVMGNSDSYTCMSNYFSAGPHSVKVVVSDGEQSTAKEWTLVVLNVNRQPVIGNYSPTGNPTINERESQVFTITKSDPDGENLSVAWQQDGAIVLENQDSFTYSAGVIGNHTITAIVSDRESSVSKEWTLTVLKANKPPIINSYSPLGNIAINEGKNQVFSITKSDPNNDPLTVEWLVDNNTTARNINSYTYRANYFSAGQHTVKAIVSDGELSTSKEWLLTVNNVPSGITMNVSRGSNLESLFTTITLQTANSLPANFRIYRKTGENSNWSRILNTTTKTTSVFFFDRNANTIGTTYYYYAATTEYNAEGPSSDIAGITLTWPPCTDTDYSLQHRLGLNYYAKGTLNSKTDFCSSITTLKEFYCGANSETQNTYYPCPKGCLNGACRT